ncbi:hypothetical protein AAGQ96_12920 [Pantoea sp. MBD-2R]|uniref:hypothetical protein n=1 Tax=Pantoea sp. MBD-2R TaxID=3141540 RepID=UPI00318452CA
MSSARILIGDFIKSHEQFVPSRNIYKHLTGLGYTLNSVKVELSRMYRRGELVRLGVTQGARYQINPDYKPSRRTLIAIESHSHLALCNRKPSERPAKPAHEDIFTQSRRNSSLSSIDQMLRGVRNAATS